MKPGYWLSFCDPDKEEDHQFLGVAIVDEREFLPAVIKAHALHINPGGEVLGVPVDIDDYNPKDIHRLLSKKEALALVEKRKRK